MKKNWRIEQESNREVLGIHLAGNQVSVEGKQLCNSRKKISHTGKDEAGLSYRPEDRQGNIRTNRGKRESEGRVDGIPLEVEVVWLVGTEILSLKERIQGTRIPAENLNYEDIKKGEYFCRWFLPTY